MKNYFEYIKKNLSNNWVECPSDYVFTVGERVKINPTSRYTHQAGANKLGTITKDNNNSRNLSRNSDSWYVEWDNGLKDCFYWRKDLLVNDKLNKDYLKRKEILRSKYKDIDPFEEENWKD